MFEFLKELGVLATVAVISFLFLAIALLREGFIFIKSIIDKD